MVSGQIALLSALVGILLTPCGGNKDRHISGGTHQKKWCGQIKNNNKNKIGLI